MTKKIQDFKKRLRKKEILILDGATGTEIQRRGVTTTLPLWSAGALLTNPDIIKEIHTDYIVHGADIITTNTFRTTERTLRKRHIYNEAKKLTRLACELAKRATKDVNVDRDIYIAGSIAPLEDCYSPQLTPSPHELEKEHLEYAQNVFKSGTDFLLIETMITVRETLACIKAARTIHAQFAVSFCCAKDGTLLSGESLKEAIKIAEHFSPLFIGINCISLETVAANIDLLRSATSLPISVYANGIGSSDDNEGWKFKGKKNIDRYVSAATQWIKKGVQIIGGCCGTTPDYIDQLSHQIKT